MSRGSIKARAEFQKVVTCGNCGCVYCVGNTRTFTGRGPTEDAAVEAAEENAHVNWGEAPSGACPHCFRRPRLSTLGDQSVMLGGLFCVTMLGGPILTGSTIDGKTTLATASLLLVGAVFAVSMACVWLVAVIPRRNWSHSRSRAIGALESGSVRIEQPGSDDPASVHPPGARGRLLLILFLGLVAAALMLTPWAYLKAKGWTENEGMRDPVCGPGDEVMVNLPDVIKSLDGHWRGQAAARLEVVDGSAGQIPLEASSRQDDWAKYQMRTEGHRESAVWVRVQIPDDPALSGKQVRIHSSVNVTYPAAVSNEKFSDFTTQIHQTKRIDLSPPGAKKEFGRVRVGSVAAGYLFTLAMISLLALAALALRQPRSTVALERRMTFTEPSF